MSNKIRKHPIYVARASTGSGCGHQHSHPEQAWNCAENMMDANLVLDQAAVVKVEFRRISDVMREHVIGHVVRDKSDDSPSIKDRVRS